MNVKVYTYDYNCSHIIFMIALILIFINYFTTFLQNVDVVNCLLVFI